jgi:hypothetical protein
MDDTVAYSYGKIITAAKKNDVHIPKLLRNYCLVCYSLGIFQSLEKQIFLSSFFKKVYFAVSNEEFIKVESVMLIITSGLNIVWI